MKGVIRILAVVGVLSLILSACAPAVAPTPTPKPTEVAPTPTPKPPEAVKLTIWATGSEDEGKVLFAGAEAFMKKHPNVTIELQPISWDDGHAKILAAATSKVGPDIMTGGLSWGIEFGELGGMVDLKARYSDKIAEIAKVVHPNIYNSVVSPGSQVYGAPWDLTVFLMYYRPDILKEITGSDQPPKTWEELTAAIEKIQAAGKKGFAMQWGNVQWLQYFNYLYQAGGTLYDEGCAKATINSPAGVKALKFFAELYTKYKAPTDGWPDLESGLASGDYPIGYTGSWVAGYLDSGKPEMAGKWRLAPLAAGSSGKPITFIGGRVIGIMAYSKHPDEAAEFIRFLYTDEAADMMVEKAAGLNLLFIPPRIDFADKIKAPADRVEAIKTQLQNAYGPPNCIGWEESARTVQTQIEEVIFKGADPQKALDEAAKVMNENLAP